MNTFNKKITSKNLKFAIIPVVIIVIVMCGVGTYNTITASKFQKNDKVDGIVIEASDVKCSSNKKDIKDIKPGTKVKLEQTIKFKYTHKGKEYVIEDKDRTDMVDVWSDLQTTVDHCSSLYNKGDVIHLYVDGDKWEEVEKLDRQAGSPYPFIIIMLISLIPIVIIYIKTFKNLKKREEEQEMYEKTAAQLSNGNTLANSDSFKRLEDATASYSPNTAYNIPFNEQNNNNL